MGMWVQVVGEALHIGLLAASLVSLRKPSVWLGANARIKRAQKLADVNVFVCAALVGALIPERDWMATSGWVLHAVSAIAVCGLARWAQRYYVRKSHAYARRLLLRSSRVSSV